jgi:predicted outer membrane protein
MNNLELALALIAKNAKVSQKRNKNQILLDLVKSGNVEFPIDRQKLVVLVNFEVLKDKNVAIDLTKTKDVKTFMDEMITTKNSVDQSISNAKSNVSFNNWAIKYKHPERLTKSSDGKLITIK